MSLPSTMQDDIILGRCPFLHSPFPAILEAFDADDPRFFETRALEFEYHLKAELPLATKTDAVLIGEAYSHIDDLGDYVGVYPAFYRITRCVRPLSPSNA